MKLLYYTEIIFTLTSRWLLWRFMLQLHFSIHLSFLFFSLELTFSLTVPLHCGILVVLINFKLIQHRRLTISTSNYAQVQRFKLVLFCHHFQGPEGCVDKPFLWTEGRVSLRAALDKSAYIHGEQISVTVDVRNDSRKIIRKIRVSETPLGHRFSS